MTTISAHTGTDRYLAYELVLGGETAAPTTASDIFALGCIGLEVLYSLGSQMYFEHIFQFYFLQQPYAHRKNNMRGQIFIDIRAGVAPATRPQPSGSQHEELWLILDRCWEHIPGNRIDAQELQTRLGSVAYSLLLASHFSPSSHINPNEAIPENR